MSVSTFKELMNHVGHDVVVAYYGVNENVAIKCLNCNEVLMDFDNPKMTPQKTVSFKFDIDDIVTIKPLKIDGVISHLLADDGGSRYYVKYVYKDKISAEYFRENLLERKKEMILMFKSHRVPGLTNEQLCHYLKEQVITSIDAITDHEPEADGIVLDADAEQNQSITITIAVD